jgi:hypothetical protein
MAAIKFINVAKRCDNYRWLEIGLSITDSSVFTDGQRVKGKT